MRSAQSLGVILALASITACKPPPTDADLRRDLPPAAPTYAADPLPSPDTEGAMWAPSPQHEGRIIYGIPGDPALLALECIDEDGELPALQITRLSPADEDASALLALVGNGHIGRIKVEARQINGRFVWQGEYPAAMIDWEPLAGPRQVTLTVPGAGMVTLNKSELAWDMLVTCRGWPALIEAPDIDVFEPPQIEASTLP